VDDSSKALRRAVVKVQARVDAPDLDQPWSHRGLDDATGSGFVVATPRGPRVLTNAHVVDHAVLVELRRFGDAARYVGVVERVSQACDLALLDVEDPGFFQGVPRLKIGGEPDLGDEVTVLGYPIGGERLSITRGVVSRIETSLYSQSDRKLLSMQIDAAINSGNSGGPVLQGDRVAGVAFESLSEGENIGYIIPSPVVAHFLRDPEPGDRFPDLGLHTQRLEAPAHRRKLYLPVELGGILVHAVDYGSSCWGHLRPGDVLLDVAGVQVAANGSVSYRGSQRLDHSYLVSLMEVGARTILGVWRGGTRVEVEVTLRPPARLIPKLEYGQAPPYLVVGGLVFVPLTLDYLWSWSESLEQVPLALRHLYWYGVRTEARQQVVTLQCVLSDRVNAGYHDLSYRVVARAQGEAPRDLTHLAALLDDPADPYLTLETARGEVLVLDRAEVTQASPRILERFGIQVDRAVPD
jgi:S1-C subfamily serine protease